jgi:hypothetical protein
MLAKMSRLIRGASSLTRTRWLQQARSTVRAEPAETTTSALQRWYHQFYTQLKRPLGWIEKDLLRLDAKAD